MAILAGADDLEALDQMAPLLRSMYRAEFGEPPRELESQQPEEQSSQVPRQQEWAPRAPEQVLLANAPAHSPSAAQLPIHDGRGPWLATNGHAGDGVELEGQPEDLMDTAQRKEALRDRFRDECLAAAAAGNAQRARELELIAEDYDAQLQAIATQILQRRIAEPVADGISQPPSLH